MRQSLGVLLIVCSVLATSMGLSGHVRAEEDAERRQPAQMQLETFEFSGRNDEEFIYFSLFLVPTKQSHLLDLCKMEPRIREAVYSLMYGVKNKHLMGVKRKHMVKASAVLTKRINRAMDNHYVDQAFFVRGEFDLEAGPIEDPMIPNPVSCSQISFRVKSIRDVDDE